MSGFKSILPSLVIIILAWSLGTICDKLETGAHVIKATEGWMSPFWLPFIIFILSSLISFATGTSWDNMAIVSPVALTLGYKLGDLPLLTITSGATFSGCVFGDHCSPVSVSTIMASIFSGSELMVYTLTQLIYAFIYAAIAGVIYIVYYNREWVHTSNLSIGNTIFCNAVFRKLLPE